MTKRRDLKKAMDYVSGEIIVEMLLCKVEEETDKIKLEELLAKVCETNQEFRRRVQHPGGKANKNMIKQYYRKISDDFNTQINEIYLELQLLNKGIKEN